MHLLLIIFPIILFINLKMEILPKQKDVQIEILNKMDDKTLINFCHINSETLNFCNTNQQFWLNRIISKFNIPLEVLNQYKRDRSWSRYYIKDLRRISDDPQGWLRWGIIFQRMDHVIGAVNSGADINFKDPRFGYIALTNAATRNYFDMVKYLIEHKADPNIIDKWGNVALSYSIQNINLEMFKYLIEHGANINNLDEHHRNNILNLPSYKEFRDYLKTL